ncbi:DUF1538 domain-containing protein [Quisquiliibacterium transsilvanicum]|uniref:DUF1538 domain-containing protein n=1 Tax=Quisquiliibacterium transsilvanicum TaxID=1549638 RepID=A0A7W8HFG8_9BURK|nr:DUF1538 domain-containing protein [Quisquiliibacterium transsilvanicum]MBB5271104.1 hypothetical protein [Quisquiliibacterium transsilvanicum]
MLKLLASKLNEVLRAIAPLIATVCVMQLTFVHAPLAQFLQFLAGAALAAIGMLLLFAGIEHGILPMGRFIGAELPRKGSILLIAGVAAALGFVTTVAEPDVLILAGQVAAASDDGIPERRLVYLIAAGVGLFAAAALLRIVFGFPLNRLLAVALVAVLALSLLAPPSVAPLAYDAGSVTTGVLTTPVLLALALGVGSVLARPSGALDGFGLLGLASLGPIIVVLLVGWLA